MGKLTDLLTVAARRGARLELSYAGALTPQEAYEVWQLAPAARVVDVRCRAELEWVGRIPDAVEIEWMGWPGREINSNFITQLQREVDSESLVLFLCRSGTRSHLAAALAMNAGYTETYNVLEGFEGDKDALGRRNQIGGWRHAGLPWFQS